MSSDDLFDDNNELEDLNASEIRIILNPELMKRRMGATAEAISGFSDHLKSTEQDMECEEDPVIQRKKLTPLQRFRQIANNVKHNLKWSKMLSKNESKSFVVRQGDGSSENTLTFDVNAFRSDVQSMGSMPPQAKNIMRKNSWERTIEEINFLFGYVDRLKCFERYSTTIKHEIAGVIYYDSFEAGRMIVRQGHPGLAFYFIMSGTVTIEVTETDRNTGESITNQLGETYAGESFGELSLLHGTNRGATIRCKYDCEFLRIDKPDFDMVLRRSYQQEWDSRMQDLQQLDIFTDWTNDEMTATTDRSRVILYQPNTVILSDVREEPDDVYFIKSGEVKIVREIVLLETRLPCGWVKLTPPPLMAERDVHPDFKPKKYQRVVRKLLHITTIGKDAFFGVGEDLRKTHMISNQKTECILVARVCFMRHRRGRCLGPMKEQVEELYPTYDETFASYLLDKRWRAYKRNLVKEIASHRDIPNNTTITDVPLILRQENSLSMK